MISTTYWLTGWFLIHAFYRGHYITNPNNALLQGKSLKNPMHLYCFDPPKIGKSMTPVLSTGSLVGGSNPWKICSSNSIISPIFGVKISKYLSCHHLVMSMLNQLRSVFVQAIGTASSQWRLNGVASNGWSQGLFFLCEKPPVIFQPTKRGLRVWSHAS